ncbi:DNA-binding MltR family transcriptional regulator [Vibrio crassostreae]|uniref:MltR family transcriptional regulator n=1 Tax=Vibrio TaxID=662 RepID=UPI000C81B87B|nr:MltR family transcriptional regulator [Vibrio crassostreae]PTP10011.1 transcriptional regulator [Vibrio sp. 10N.286.45.A3]PTQ25290.1 transcriptional regulator [Vibrio sp. 10N.286.46.E10]TKE87498.1 transcriptional regulator [Vibrio sp. F12]NOH74948.1 transcriptional regulator [Vibrio crassostreae]NOI54857.1 transcriptional regulator [Vibrio crassostreae]
MRKLDITVQEELLDALEECANATCFIKVSHKLINSKLKQLLPRVFVQDPLVLEYAVTPLLKEDGPLVEIDVVSKLMFAMGKISLETYADIGLFEQMHGFVIKQPNAIQFNDDMIYDFICNQSTFSKAENNIYLDSINQLKFSSFDAFSKARYESLIKTVLKLSCESLLETVEKEILN